MSIQLEPIPFVVERVTWLIPLPTKDGQSTLALLELRKGRGKPVRPITVLRERKGFTYRNTSAWTLVSVHKV